MLDANFWQDKNNSQKVIKEKKLYEDLINSFNNSDERLKDLDDLFQLAMEEENLVVQKEVLNNIKRSKILIFLSNYFHFILQPIDGNCSRAISCPDNRAFIALLKSFPFGSFPEPGEVSSHLPR